ncbi:efflux RND transporter permease subunit [Pseudomarimonas arenosa]|uniref:Efflux RND transporter permease subunit n=1 Tax=Pseudomarimonas arenosa TaxID=2774145 RepID=A0AAW3ZNF2_9GAMM|nr:efflux RND transporter permease subunit [Pseudomarimonas arenosa]MBD8526162.1 efflux RND transporter permease subunit [Pseudomarimonas arenosa]
MRLLESLIRNHPLANIAFAVVIIMGLLSYLRMPREQDPEINFNWVNISTALPGASAADVEERVTNPLEDSLRNVQDIKFVASSSREGVSNILVRFRDMPERQFDKRINDLRREIQNTASAELPADVIDPVVLEITTSNSFPTAMVVVTGPAADETLRFASRGVQQDLEQIAGVDRVLALGFQDPELLVEFDPEALAARGATASQLADALRFWFRDIVAGKLKTGGSEWLIRVQGTSADPAEVGDFALRLPGSAHSVPLDQVAMVRRGMDTPRHLAATDGRAAVLMSVSKVSGLNTLDLVQRISDYVKAKNDVLAVQGLSIAMADDQTIPTRDALRVMQSNALIGLVLVMAVCWVFLGSRIAIMVSLGVVFSIAGAIWVLSAMGNTLNVSVLLGIVIVLGMLVDDAVVVVEAIYFRLQRGMPAMPAALESLSEVGLPVTAAVATTMAAFLPLMLLPGIVGKFMFVIPLVVTIGLAVSLVEAIWMLPAHVTTLGKHSLRQSGTQAWRERWTHRVRVRYTRALIHVMRRPGRYLLLALALFLGAIGAVASGAVKMQFFAFDPLRIFYVNVDMPADSPIEQTLRRTSEVEQIVRSYLQKDEARSVVSLAGIKFTEMEPVYGDHYGQITVSLNPAGNEDRNVDEVIEAMRTAIEQAPGASHNSFLRIAGGPPASKPISVKVRGDDLDELRRATAALKERIKEIPGAHNVQDNDTAGRAEFSLRVDVDAARRAGLDAGDVARLVRLHVDGEVVADLRDRGEKLELRVRAAPRTLDRIDALLADPVALPGGGMTSLGTLLVTEQGLSPGLIRHWNFRRAITVEAELAADGVDTLEADRLLKAAWEGLRLNYPGVDLDFSGELDDINESLAAMPPLFLLGLGLIYLILAAQFRSYFQPLLILVTVPLAFIGVTLGLLISQNPMSLYTLYGVIALTGISVNAAIVLIDAANTRRANGMRTLHATLYAARRRVIAVLMTTGTTIAGLFSLAFGIGGKSLLWGPVASSIVWGLSFSAALTLFVVPVLYRYFNQQGGPGGLAKPRR